MSATAVPAGVALPPPAMSVPVSSRTTSTPCIDSADWLETGDGTNRPRDYNGYRDWRKPTYFLVRAQAALVRNSLAAEHRCVRAEIFCGQTTVRLRGQLLNRRNAGGASDWLSEVPDPPITLRLWSSAGSVTPAADFRWRCVKPAVQVATATGMYYWPGEARESAVSIAPKAGPKWNAAATPAVGKRCWWPTHWCGWSHRPWSRSLQGVH